MIISLDSYLNIVSSYIILITCIDILLVKFKVIYQQAFAHNTQGADLCLRPSASSACC